MSAYRETLMPGRYADKVVVVTGGGSGIGRATAIRFAAEGGHIAVLDRDLETATETVTMINAAGGEAMAVACDVTDYSSVVTAIEAVTATLGAIDVVGNIAGIGHLQHTHLEDPARFARVIAVNLTGTFHVCRAVLPGMVERGHGVIVNTASSTGLKGQTWSAAYCASKGAVIMLTKALATEYNGTGIRVLAIGPGSTQTNIINGFMPPAGADWTKLDGSSSVLGWCDPAEIAAGFAYVASDEARFMQGSIVMIDGAITC